MARMIPVSTGDPVMRTIIKQSFTYIDGDVMLTLVDDTGATHTFSMSAATMLEGINAATVVFNQNLGEVLVGIGVFDSKAPSVL